MSSRIESYIADLDSRLARHVEEPRRAELIEEVRTHLLMSVKASDEKEALRAFGPVRTVAEDLIRREKGLDTKPAIKLALWPMVLLFIAVVTPGFFWVRQEMVFYEIGDWASKLFFVAFVWSVWKTRRWLAPALILPLIAASLITYALDAKFATNAFAGEKPKQIKMYETWIGDVEKNLEPWGRAAKGDLSGVKKEQGYDAPVFGPSSISYHIPLLPTVFTWEGAAETPSMSANLPEREARQLWSRNGTAFIERQRSLLSDLRTQHADLIAGQIGFRFSWEWVGRILSVWAIQLTLLFGTNGLLLWLTKLTRNRRIRRDPHLA